MELDNKTTDSDNCALSFDDFKKSLGAGAAKYSDAQIEQIRITFDRIADAVFDDWLKRLNAQ